MTAATLYYFHDPMCSWCWGYRPTSDKLFQNLPDSLDLIRVLGGLAPDSDEPMPQAQREAIPGYWKKIEDMLGTEFNYDFWSQCEPRRSTYPACRAVIAAELQQAGTQMTDAIQRGYYTRAMNPSDVSTLVTLAGEIDLDVAKFEQDIASKSTEQELQRQLAFTRDCAIRGFPSLLLEKESRLIPVVLDYKDQQVTLDQLGELLQT